MSGLAHYQKYQRHYEVLMVVLFIFINTTILATTIVMEAYRNGPDESFELWVPFANEYSSGLGMLLLVPLAIWFIRRYPPTIKSPFKTLISLLLGSIVFSILHVSIMVLLRETIWWLMDKPYSFGNIGYELLYEYRKDLWTFLTIIIIFKSYQFILKHLLGEAEMIKEEEDQKQIVSDRLLVRKMGSEFIIKITDIEWLEASGNYVNLHIGNRIYPLRSTLAGLVSKIEDRGFTRVHRSYAVNLDQISAITPLPSGDSEIKLRDGKVINLSRRYKENIKQFVH